MRILLAALATACALGLPARADELDAAMQAYLAEDFSGALDGFEKALAREPARAQRDLIQYCLAVSQIKTGRPAEAVRTLEDLIERRPRDPSAASCWAAIGEAYLDLGRRPDALASFERAWIRPAPDVDRARLRAHLRRLVAPVVAPAPDVRPVAAVKDTTNSSSPVGRGSNGLEGGWVVQVLSAPDEPTALERRQQLLTDGWPVLEVKPAIVDGTAYYRVRVGPYRDKAEASNAKSRIDSAYGIQSWVTQK